MPNPNPYKARAATIAKHRPAPGTVQELRAVLWRAISKLEAHLEHVTHDDAPNTAELCKLTHAISQSGATYMKAVEVGELEARVQEIEARYNTPSSRTKEARA